MQESVCQLHGVKRTLST